MLHDDHRALVVDPGEAHAAADVLRRLGLKLEAILVTHHHSDHTGAVDLLRQSSGARVFGPAREAMPEPIVRLADGDRFEILGLTFEVLEVPGHTAGHVAYYCAEVDGAPLLFCGDTLFSGGCGRLFEGSPAQMLASLNKLAALPDATRVCCAHEYTVANLRFGAAVEPDNQVLREHMSRAESLRARHLPTLPSCVGLERQINPFLRTHLPSVIRAIQEKSGAAQEPVALFAALREWKNQFQ